MKKIIILFLMSCLALQAHASKITISGGPDSLNKQVIDALEGSFEFTRKNTLAVLLTNPSGPRKANHIIAFAFNNENQSTRFTDDPFWEIYPGYLSQSRMGTYTSSPVKFSRYFDPGATTVHSNFTSSGHRVSSMCNECKRDIGADQTGIFQFKLPSTSLLLLTKVDLLSALYTVGARVTPIPAKIWLLISGLLGFVGLSSRKKTTALA